MSRRHAESNLDSREEPLSGRDPPHMRYSVDTQQSPPTTWQMYNVDVQHSNPPSLEPRHARQAQTSGDMSYFSPDQSHDPLGYQNKGTVQKQYHSHSSLSRHHNHERHVTSPELYTSHTAHHPHTSHTLPHSYASHRHSAKERSRPLSYADSSSNQGTHPHHSRHSTQPDRYNSRRHGDSGVDLDLTLTPSSQTSYDGRGNPLTGTHHTHQRLAQGMNGNQSDSAQGSKRSYSKTRPTGRPSSGHSRKLGAVKPSPWRPLTPNPSTMNRGEAWQLEEDFDGQEVIGVQRFNVQVSTVNHMDQALLPQKHYFPNSPSHPPHSSHPPHPSHPPQPSQASHHPLQNHTGEEEMAPRPFSNPPPGSPPPHSRLSDPPVSPIIHRGNQPPSHHTSQDFSQKSSSGTASGHTVTQRHGRRDNNKNGRRGSYTSVDSSHSSGSHKSNAGLVSAGMRRSPSLPLKPGSVPVSSDMGRGQRTPFVVDPQMMVAPEHVTNHETSPGHVTSHMTGHRRHSTSDSHGKIKRRHQYEQVRAPHPYESMPLGDNLPTHPTPPRPTPITPPQLSPPPQSTQESQEEIPSPNSKRLKRGFLKRDSRSKNGPALKKSLNASDTKLSGSTKKLAGSVKSPAANKRHSVGNILDESIVRVDLTQGHRHRMSSPEEQLHAKMVHRYFPNEVKATREANGDVKEQSLSDSDGTPPTKRTVRSKSAGTVVFHKLTKKLKKLSAKSGAGDPGEGSDGSGGGGSTSWSKKAAKKKKKLSSSVSNLTDMDEPSRLTQSMERLDACHNLGGTPKMTRSSSRNKLSRRGSEAELEGSLFRSGSKRNLAADPTEALFDLIEQGKTEDVEQLLYSMSAMDLNLSATNEDDLLPLDLAAMLNHEEIARLLLEKGAKDSTRFCKDTFSRFSRIASLLSESERELDSLQHELLTQSVSNSSGIREQERRLRRWEWKNHLYKKMKLTYESAGVPGPPGNVSLHITSSRSLTVTFTEPQDTNGAVITRYKIEWCRSEGFYPIVGEFIMTDLRAMEYAIPDLDKGEPYFVRVSAYNMRGFGPASLANPSSAIPSNWHDEDSSHPRYEGKTDQMYTLSAELGMMLSQSPSMPSASLGASSANRPMTSLRRRLFGSNVKFQKSLKYGVYLAVLVYSDDRKVLITQDDQIPILEVSDSDPSKKAPDFVWLAKVACTWEHVRSMYESTGPYTSSPTVQFRNKLLHAVLNFQEALGMQDLGLLHPVPFKDKHGASVYVLVQNLRDAKLPQTASSSFKWSALPRLRKGRTPPSAEELKMRPVPEQILFDAQEIIAHHMNSTRKLGKGLYLGYLKNRSSVSAIQVVCSREYPNVLPYMKIRNNSNISRDEWQWFKSLSSSNPQPLQAVRSHQSLQETLLPKIETFLHNLGISKEDVPQHQIYKREAIELNEDITFLLLLPPAEHVCTPPGSTDHFAKLPDFVALPVNIFEIMQLYTYQRNFMTKYSMVSARLEVELLNSAQRIRGAFSNEEGRSAKKLNEELENYHKRAEPAWKQMRWIEEAVQKGRDQSDVSDSLISVATIREGISRARQVLYQQQLDAERRREREAALSSRQHQHAGLSSGYLRVFPAYNTGLVKGTSVKLFITVMTSTTEVIRLVVHQLEKARLDRGVPGNRLTEEDLTDFYLVGLTDTKEWVIDSRAYPLTLQTSTRKLEVRRRSEQSRLDENVTSV